METQGQLREKNGLKPSDGNGPTTERYFYESLSEKGAEKVIHEKGTKGCFLLRKSKTKPGLFVISAQSEDKVIHVGIQCQDKKFYVNASDRFASLGELIKHYKANPMIEPTGKHRLVTLKEPLNSTKFPASGITSRIQVLSLSHKSDQKDQKEDTSGFEEEFESLERIGRKTTFARREGQRPENKAKNRYRNILPYDYSRVVLRDEASTILGSDYINANHIKFDDEKGKPSGSKYIATQGPLCETSTDFWRMVWLEKSRLIVMITKDTERGKSKCSRYWPDEGQTKEWSKIKVKTLAQKESSVDCIWRQLLVTKEGETSSRTINHYQFTGWPDHGVPEDPRTVLSFMLDVNRIKQTIGSAGPIIVHCSAGIGRTGTFIAIDSLMDEIKRNGMSAEIDIQRKVEMMRRQREGMVQTEDQYLFLYLVIQSFLLHLTSPIISVEQKMSDCIENNENQSENEKEAENESQAKNNNCNSNNNSGSCIPSYYYSSVC